MFEEPLAAIIRDHCKEHMPALLTEVTARRGDAAQLPMPKRFEVSSLVGGTSGVSRATLPAMAFDFDTKDFVGFNGDNNLWEYAYQGIISCLVVARTSEEVERLAKRYDAATELYVQRHQYLPMPSPIPPVTDWGFLITGFAFARSRRMGAAQVDEKGAMVWIDGFTMEVEVRTSENGPFQHS